MEKKNKTIINKELLIGINPNSRLIKEYKLSLIELSKIQFEASIGLMLGDASIQTQNKGKNYRLTRLWRLNGVIKLNLI